jgi:NodT family efflux transporter outer membrane factor (OMF) lipoprotein
MIRWLAPILLPLLLLGCAGAPRTTESPLDIAPPASWASLPASSTLEMGSPAWDLAWWQGFEDVRLDSLVAHALRRNHDLAQAAASVDAARAQARIAGADLWPQVAVGGTAARQKRSLIGFTPPAPGFPTSTTTTTYAASADASWEVDLWGRIRSGRSAAVADVEAANAAHAGAALSLAGQTTKAWFAAVEALQQEELAEETVASYALTADHVRRRYDSGIAGALDVRLAESDLAASRGTLAVRRQVAASQIRRLEVLVGRYPAATLKVVRALPTSVPDVPAGLPAELVSRRPDLVEAERRAASAGARVTEARRALYPRISLTGSAGTTSTELRDLVDPDFSVWSLLGNLALPLFQGGRLRAQVDLAQARERQALEGYASAVLTAYAEVENALDAERHLAEREARVAEAADHARRAAELAQSQYDAGLVTITTLLDARRRALAADSQLREVRRQRLDARVDLHLVLGGGFGRWDPDPREPPASPSSDASTPKEATPS